MTPNVFTQVVFFQKLRTLPTPT